MLISLGINENLKEAETLSLSMTDQETKGISYELFFKIISGRL